MKTVLYVEDNFADRELMIRVINQAKPRFELRLQDDYSKILDYLRNRGLFDNPRYFPPPDLVLLDYSVGNFKGTELLSWIRTKSERQTLPVVMFSGRTEEQIVAECYAMGANYFIAKSPQTTQRLRLVNSLDVCLQTMPPHVENLAELATSPTLSRWPLRREAREYPTECAPSVLTVMDAEEQRRSAFPCAVK